MIHWSKLQRTQVRLTPRMWHDAKGDVIPVKDNLVGESRTRGHIPGWHQVRFDRSYVIRFVISKVLVALMITSKEQAVDLITQVWDIHSRQELDERETNETTH